MGKKVANMAGWQIWPWDTLVFKDIIDLYIEYIAGKIGLKIVFVCCCFFIETWQVILFLIETVIHVSMQVRHF